jgi:hypothetical protein
MRPHNSTGFLGFWGARTLGVQGCESGDRQREQRRNLFFKNLLTGWQESVGAGKYAIMNCC